VRARARANHAKNDVQKGCAVQLNGITLRSLPCIALRILKPGPNESESCREFMRVQTLDLIWSQALMHSRRLSPALIEFEPAQIFVESRREFALVWSAFVLSRDELSSTLVLVWLGGR